MQPDALAARVLDAPARLRASRLVCLEGRSGAGKTELAGWLSTAVELAGGGPVTVVHMDDVYAGWSGLASAGRLVWRMLVEPWLAGEHASLAAWDWNRGTRRDPGPLPLTPVVLVEGVGSWSQRYADAVSTLVWLDCDDHLRRDRALTRDGAAFAPRWQQWTADEQRLYVREQTRAHADVILDTGAQDDAR